MKLKKAPSVDFCWAAQAEEEGAFGFIFKLFQMGNVDGFEKFWCAHSHGHLPAGQPGPSTSSLLDCRSPSFPTRIISPPHLANLSSLHSWLPASPSHPTLPSRSARLPSPACSARSAEAWSWTLTKLKTWFSVFQGLFFLAWSFYE